MEELYQLIGLPLSVIERLEIAKSQIDQLNLNDTIRQLTDAKTASQTYQILRRQLHDDSDNWKMLYCQLEAAKLCYSKYQDKGIPNDIYVATMKCFTRFLIECEKKNDRMFFDRGWWTYRQTSMSLFRIGELEYEFKMSEEENMIGIHIPSDATITYKAVGESLKKAKDFFGKYFPMYGHARYTCDSWLLVSGLKALLPDQSNIVDFQRRFQIVRENPEDREFIEWLFQMPIDTCYDELSAKTRLQMNAKEYLINGGKIGKAYGILLEE